MSIHRYQHKELIKAPLEKVWDFFSRPANLARVTPTKMGLRDVYPHDAEQVYPGMCVVHSVAPLLGIRLIWVTRIVAVAPLERFVDVQASGPFALWHHIHEFRAVEGATEMNDILYYALPLGPLGDLAHTLFAKKQVAAIFAHRSQAVQQIF
jgi:ligand-binding SRPBCC domain-containing protein